MAKFYGRIGYAESVETAPGVWVDGIVSRSYVGDVIKNTNRWVPGEGVNDDLTLSNKFSIVADPYAFMHFHSIKYVKWMGAYWKVTAVEPQRPRLILTIGGVYNGETD